MKRIVDFIAGAGDWLVSLSPGTRKVIVIVLLLILGSGGVYKLVIALDKLNRPLPAASSQEFIEPMQQLFVNTQQRVVRYQSTRQQQAHRLDSLAHYYSTKKNPH